MPLFAIYLEQKLHRYGQKPFKWSYKSCERMSTYGEYLCVNSCQLRLVTAGIMVTTRRQSLGFSYSDFESLLKVPTRHFKTQLSNGLSVKPSPRRQCGLRLYRSWKALVNEYLCEYLFTIYKTNVKIGEQCSGHCTRQLKPHTNTQRGGCICIYSSQSNVYLTWTLKLIYSAAIWKQVSTLFKSPHCTVLNIFIIFTENISFCSLFNFCWRTPCARCAQLSSHHERTWYLSQNEEPLIRRGHRPKYF